MDPKKIAVHYLKTWFVIDLVSSLPFNLLLAAGSQNTVTNNVGSVLLSNTNVVKVSKLAKIFRIARVLKMIKMTRVLRASRIFAKLEDFFLSNACATFMLIFKLLAILLIFAHLLACMWIMTLTYNPEGMYIESWIHSMGLVDEFHSVSEDAESQFTVYTAAFYWAITTLTTVGYGDISPQTNGERIFCIVCMVVGGTLYAYIIGTISSAVASSDAKSREYQLKMEYVESYMGHRSFPRDLYIRVRRHYRHYLSQKAILDEQQMLNGLSAGLRLEVESYLVDRFATELPIFAHLDEYVLLRLQTLMKPLQIDIGEFLFFAGNNGYEMFVFQRGSGDVYSTDDEFLYNAQDGDTVGEICAFGFSEVRPFSVKCTMFTDLISLHRDDIFEACETFPSQFQKMKDTVRDKYTSLVEDQSKLTFDMLTAKAKDFEEDSPEDSKSEADKSFTGHMRRASLLSKGLLKARMKIKEKNEAIEKMLEGDGDECTPLNYSDEHDTGARNIQSMKSKGLTISNDGLSTDAARFLLKSVSDVKRNLEKVNKMSARHDTMLDDLQIQMRNNFDDLMHKLHSISVKKSI